MFLRFMVFSILFCKVLSNRRIIKLKPQKIHKIYIFELISTDLKSVRETFTGSSPVPGTILYNQANCRIFGNHRRGSAEFFQFQQARPAEAQTDRLLLPDCLKRNAADEESQSLDY